MNLLREKFRAAPEWARVGPFFIFVLLTSLQGQFGEGSRYWLYLAKTLVGARLIFEIRPYVPEMRWRISASAVAMGVAVWAVWVGLDGYYPRLAQASAGANLNWQFGAGTPMSWFFVAVDLLGSSVVVPPLEEVF